MTLIRNRATINLTEKEREAIETVKNLANDLFYGFKPEEIARFNDIMKASWGNTDNIEVAICDLSCLLDSFQENIDTFNKGIDPN